ncbi:hypothetical protein [Candidatus Albibeggiatoa sp. nov. BB20]|uniref:hypothetical protein n=1 Tax=Candidatus Albibeggiatoa sp. nov. BB20 TaxID=3162723 RepID=UPI00336593C5
MHTQRLLALVSLIAQKPIQQQDCLSDEQLIGFINHELTGRALHQARQHLHACPDCYREWQDSCDLMMDTPNINLHKKTYWAERLGDLFSIKLIFTAASAFASIIAIVLLLPVFYQNSLQQQINQSYQQLASFSAEQIKMTKMDDVATGFSFATSEPLTPQQLAFQQGVDAGYGLLKQSNHLQQEITKLNYYELGRWITLLDQATQTDTELPIQFWQQQQSILQAVRQDFINDSYVIPHLDKLANFLEQLPNSEQPHLYDKLYRYIDFIKQDLGYR